jgi:hypothetical protein
LPCGRDDFALFAPLVFEFATLPVFRFAGALVPALLIVFFRATFFATFPAADFRATLGAAFIPADFTPDFCFFVPDARFFAAVLFPEIGTSFLRDDG